MKQTSESTKLVARRGYTMVELLVVITLLGILVVGFAVAFRGFALHQRFVAEVRSVGHAVVDQKSKSMTGVNGSVHGFDITQNQMVLFEGRGYSAGSPTNQIVVFEYANATSSLSQGTTTVYFDGLTGTSSATGTISMYNDSVGATSTITIYESGVIEY